MFKTKYHIDSILVLISAWFGGQRLHISKFNFMLTYRRKLTEVNFMFIIF